MKIDAFLELAAQASLVFGVGGLAVGEVWGWIIFVNWLRNRER